MKILVTGGTGFIGSHTVVELQEAGYQPVILDNLYNSNKEVLTGLKAITGRDTPFYEIDSTDEAAVRKLFETEKFDGVIHFAAYKAVGESVAEPLKYYENNLGSLIVLLKVMKDFGVSNFVFSSSCTVYGQPDVLPVTEDTPRQPATSPYGNTKAISEDIIRDHVYAKPGLKALSLRYFNPVGAHPSAEIGELPSGVPSNLVPYLTQAAAGLREKLVVFGDDYDTPDGTCIRDFIHVVDLAKAHVKALELLNRQPETNFYDVFNVGTGQGNTVLELIETFERANGVKLNYTIGPRRPGDVEKIWAQSDKANSKLAWKTEKTLEDSLRDAWRWQQKITKG
ncbi:UDP-glucose 4-epimerase GalE [Salmonirosea aquatica]|uniref:UDP-glucose 4-epimerase n=1 Tax=Salmonirosea aquatica TaxID=2654236 RepID=A0A7C9F586_9BACT|nr:UDP-glucose 4-epimerase GalE [Cytophagaceae bacterium SJW1-29]